MRAAEAARRMLQLCRYYRVKVPQTGTIRQKTKDMHFIPSGTSFQERVHCWTSFDMGTPKVVGFRVPAALFLVTPSFEENKLHNTFSLHIHQLHKSIYFTHLCPSKAVQNHSFRASHALHRALSTYLLRSLSHLSPQILATKQSRLHTSQILLFLLLHHLLLILLHGAWSRITIHMNHGCSSATRDFT